MVEWLMVVVVILGLGFFVPRWTSQLGCSRNKMGMCSLADGTDRAMISTESGSGLSVVEIWSHCSGVHLPLGSDGIQDIGLVIRAVYCLLPALGLVDRCPRRVFHRMFTWLTSPTKLVKTREDERDGGNRDRSGPCTYPQDEPIDQHRSQSPARSGFEKG